jgi:cytochrome P450 family 142 subfamily A polypeptide 1
MSAVPSEGAAAVSAGPRPVVDLMDGRFYAGEPHPAWAWMRANEPVYHDETNDLWGVTRYADVRTASLDPATFSNSAGVRPKFYAMPMMIEIDPPVHTRRRKLVSAGFTPRRVAQLAEHVRAVCDELIDAVAPRGECDFVRDVAAQLPLIMIGDLLGVAPADRADLLRWSDEMLRSQGDPSEESFAAASQAFVEYCDYMKPVIAQRQQTGNTDDLVGVLANAEIEGDRLTEDDLLFETLLILIGGDETTRHVLSGGLLALLEHPDQLAELRADRQLLPRAVEEMLRWVTPIQDMARTLTRDAKLGGVELREGDQVLLLYPSANRDEAVFADPYRFDIHRDPNPHLAFGQGAHFCLGNQLARLELSVLFDRLLDRLPELRLAGAGPFPRRASNFVSGLESLPVEFRAG